jgi:malate dehydrogenase (decarboxylating)
MAAASISRSLLRRSRCGGGEHHLLLLARGFVTAECHRPVVLHKRGSDILHDPWFNRVRTLSSRSRSALVFFPRGGARAF